MRSGFFLVIIFICTGLFSQTTTGVDNALYTRRAADITASMSDSVLVAQVLLAGIDGKTHLTPAMRSILERVPAGGIILFKYNLDTPKEDVKKLLAETTALVKSGAGIAPFIAVDHEGGVVNRFGPGVERLPSAFSFWELAQKEGRDASLTRAETMYRRSAQEIRELGITMVLGPVAETLNTENQRFLETRSYGSDHDFTGEAASAFVKSMSAYGIASAVKHFPGNGAADPHDGAVEIKAGKPALDEMVKPFAAIIRSQHPSAIMLSHVMVPALDSRKNASLSDKVIKDWLRGELGFKGIVLADDFSMGAIAANGISPGAAAVEAINAGVDMIIVWPKDMIAVHSSILNALKEKRISRERLEEAASRVIAEKLRYQISYLLNDLS
jgi:beta-N-acetylhexosaminidase